MNKLDPKLFLPVFQPGHECPSLPSEKELYEIGTSNLRRIARLLFRQIGELDLKIARLLPAHDAIEAVSTEDIKTYVPLDDNMQPLPAGKCSWHAVPLLGTYGTDEGTCHFGSDIASWCSDNCLQHKRSSIFNADGVKVGRCAVTYNDQHSKYAHSEKDCMMTDLKHRSECAKHLKGLLDSYTEYRKNLNDYYDLLTRVAFQEAEPRPLIPIWRSSDDFHLGEEVAAYGNIRIGVNGFIPGHVSATDKYDTVTVTFLDGNLHNYQACDPRLISIDDALFLSRNHDYLKLWASIYDTQTHGDISQVCGSIVAEKVIEAYGNLNVTALFEAFDITPLFRNYGTTATPTPTSTVTKEEPGDTK